MKSSIDVLFTRLPINDVTLVCLFSCSVLFVVVFLTPPPQKKKNIDERECNGVRERLELGWKNRTRNQSRDCCSIYRRLHLSVDTRQKDMFL